MEDFNQLEQPAKPNNNLPLAIASMIAGIFSCGFCCIGFIVGIVSVVFSTQVDKKYNTSDYIGAESAAKTAKILAFIALGLTAVSLIVAAINLANGGMDEIMNAYQEAIENAKNN